MGVGLLQPGFVRWAPPLLHLTTLTTGHSHHLFTVGHCMRWFIAIRRIYLFSMPSNSTHK